MTINYIFFIYGLCVMFFSLMAWFFLNKNREMLSRLVAVLMIVLAVQWIKDLFFILPEENNARTWMIITSLDMVAVPLYAFLLIELCKPGSLTWRMMLLHEVPFVLFPILFIVTHARIFYYADVVWAGIYGFGAAVWAVITIPKYHKLLKERFSYVENINLNWLRYILLSFFVVLSLWIIDCLVIINFDIEALYLVGSIIIWMNICYFIYRHESVIEEFAGIGSAELSDTTESTETDISEIGQKIAALFRDEYIFLNPNLKLSDIAKAIGTNRTYVSTFFNRDAGCTFYDYVNRYRVNYACQLLEDSRERINVIAEKSGFNSPQSFVRVFNKIKGVSPTKYRADMANS